MRAFFIFVIMIQRTDLSQPDTWDIQNLQEHLPRVYQAQYRLQHNLFLHRIPSHRDHTHISFVFPPIQLIVQFYCIIDYSMGRTRIQYEDQLKKQSLEQRRILSVLIPESITDQTKNIEWNRRYQADNFVHILSIMLL